MSMYSLMPHRCTIYRRIDTPEDTYGQKDIIPRFEAYIHNVRCRFQESSEKVPHTREMRTPNHQDTLVAYYTLYMEKDVKIRASDRIGDIIDNYGVVIGPVDDFGNAVVYDIFVVEGIRLRTREVAKKVILEYVGAH